jgi:hypothetical protein
MSRQPSIAANTCRPVSDRLCPPRLVPTGGCGRRPSGSSTSRAAAAHACQPVERSGPGRPRGRLPAPVMLRRRVHQLVHGCPVRCAVARLVSQHPSTSSAPCSSAERNPQERGRGRPGHREMTGAFVLEGGPLHRARPPFAAIPFPSKPPDQVTGPAAPRQPNQIQSARAFATLTGFVGISLGAATSHARSRTPANTCKRVRTRAVKILKMAVRSHEHPTSLSRDHIPA